MDEGNSDNFNCAVTLFGLDEYQVNLDKFRCFLAYFSLTLNQINIGYICMAPLIVIILISIFGRIKDNYRWFILNQAFWDLALCYSYICNNWVSYFFTGNINFTCFYDFKAIDFKELFVQSISTNSYSALLLLSFSRFLCLYFPHFYETLTRNKRIFYIIFIFNFVATFTNISTFFGNLLYERKNNLIEECFQQAEKNNATQDLCKTNNYEDDFQINLFKTFDQVFSCIIIFKPMLFLFLSLLSAVLIFSRVIKQFKFQFKHNRKDLFVTIRICAVILLQTIINLLVLIIECANKIPIFIANLLGVNILITSNLSFYSESECNNCIDFRLPTWLDGEYGLAYLPVLQAIIQLRVFIESIIVLFIMTGYRESFLRCIKIIIKKNQNSTSNVTMTRVSSFK